MTGCSCSVTAAGTISSFGSASARTTLPTGIRAGSDGGGFVIGMLWNGHTDTRISGRQPKAGWEPGAAFFYEDPNGDGIGRFALHPSRDFFDLIGSTPFALEEGSTYNFAVRVEQVGLYRIGCTA